MEESFSRFIERRSACVSVRDEIHSAILGRVSRWHGRVGVQESMEP